MSVGPDTHPRGPSGQRAARPPREPGAAYPHHSPHTGSYEEIPCGSSGATKNLGVHLSWFSGFRWSQGLAGYFLGGGNSRDKGVTGGTMGESAKEANVDTVGVT